MRAFCVSVVKNIISYVKVTESVRALSVIRYQITICTTVSLITNL